MINLEVKTKLSQEEVIERLKRHFGKGGFSVVEMGVDLVDTARAYTNSEHRIGLPATTASPFIKLE